jgi:hypothetical protein
MVRASGGLPEAALLALSVLVSYICREHRANVQVRADALSQIHPATRTQVLSATEFADRVVPAIAQDGITGAGPSPEPSTLAA